MNHIEYLALNTIDVAQLLPILNKQKIRKHLVDHQHFDEESLKTWLKTKIEMDSSPGCRIRAVVVNKHLAGWCGIQRSGEKYEIAVVLDDSHWGAGRIIFREIMTWAKDLGHETVSIHFLHTRPEYKFLRKIANSVYESELMDNTFTTYELSVY